MKWLYAIDEVVLSTLHAARPLAPAKATRRDRKVSLQSEELVSHINLLNPFYYFIKEG